MKIGVIGCGNMGGGMAKTLSRNGMDVLAFDLDENLSHALTEFGVTASGQMMDIATQCEFIILSLPNAKIVTNVMSELHSIIEAKSVIIDTSTSEPNVTQEIASQASMRDYYFVDAPVSGGPIAANSGNMTMLLGGDEIAIKKAKPIFDILAGKQVYLGASGAAHTAKIANNLLCAANLVLVGEMVKLCEALKIDPKLMLEGVNAGSGRSGVSEVNFEKWILNDGFDSGFSMGLMRKDVNLARSLMEENGLNLLATKEIVNIWNASRSEIKDDADFNEIVKYGDKK